MITQCFGGIYYSGFVNLNIFKIETKIRKYICHNAKSN